LKETAAFKVVISVEEESNAISDNPTGNSSLNLK
jgi:hypothetical protein